jgi:ELWxxDGT repeat protein
VSDGTAAGTFIVRDIVPGGDSSYASPTLAVGDVVYLVADDRAAGYELWRTDGTAAGTSLVADILPGPAGSYPQTLLDSRGTLLFGATDGTSGWELWMTDGTAAGTRLVADIAAGPGSSHPEPVGEAGGLALYAADDGSTGRELWALSINHAPGADAGPDQTIEEGTAVRLDGSRSSDPDGDALSYEWRDSSGAVVGTEAVVEVGPVPAGTHVYELSVSDGLLSTRDALVVTVTALPSAITVSDTAVSEGPFGVTSATFRLSLSRAVEHPVTVHYATQPGTAEVFVDYLPASGTMTFPAGAVSAIVDVWVRGDRRCESDETFTLVLSNAAGAELSDGDALGTIVNDDCGRQ